MRTSGLLALAASLSSVSAVYQGFNYGSTNSDGSPKTQQQFTDEFNNAKNLVGTSGFTSARLYTSIQGGSSTNEPIQAIPAAISTGTTLLLGLWASGGQNGINAELIALNTAISKWGTAFTDLVAGVSIGSEDLYRISPTGIAAMSGYGADPATVVSYIGQVRQALAGTALKNAKIGHVDTWTAWVNGSNSAVVDAVDWIGVDAYPYFQNTQANGIENNAALFNDAFSATVAVSKGKEVWITETGFPVSGKSSGAAVPSVANAKQYWDQVGCANFGKVNTWWYTMFDAPSNPSFGIVGNTLSTTPAFDLSCAAVASSSAPVAPATSTSTSASVPPVVAGSTPSAAPSSTSVSTSSTPPVVPTSAASSGGGLSPGQGNGIVTASANSTAPAVPVATSTLTTIVTGNGTAPTSTPSRASTAPGSSATLPSGASNFASGSMVAGALALVCAIMASL